MSRTVGSYGPKTLEAIRKAGLRLIYEHGYEGMSLRKLAAEVGIRQGSLYNHIDTKQELLFDLVRHHMEQVLQELDGALVGIEDPVDRLRAFVAFHVNYHMVRKKEIFVVDFELRSLEPSNYSTIVEMRRAYEKRPWKSLRRYSARRLCLWGGACRHLRHSRDANRCAHGT